MNRPHGALHNARTSWDRIARAVQDRRELDPAVLDESTCWELLATHAVGRLAYVARAGVPDVVPVNFVVDGRSLLVRSGPGPKLQAAERRDRVAFEVDDPVPGGWSVVVHGRARLVPPSARLDVDPQPLADGPRRHLMRIEPVRVTGRRLAGAP